MKIKCINIFNEYTKQFVENDPWLTIGNEYIVLEVEIYLGKEVLYRLIGGNENKSPALYNSSQFEVTSGKLPANWAINQLKSGALHFGPKAWQEPGFWEDCYDGEPAALEIYKREARIIMDEENAL